jgi:hypothetical protein
LLANRQPDTQFDRMTENLPSSYSVEDANIQNSVVRSSLRSKRNIETVSRNIRHNNVTAGNIMQSITGDDSVIRRLILQQCMKYGPNITEAMNVSRSHVMHGLNNLSVDSDAHHQQ